MNRWNDFVNSLATSGANILILWLSAAGLFLALLHVMHHGDSGNIATTIGSTFSGFAGALLNALVSGSKSNKTADTKQGE